MQSAATRAGGGRERGSASLELVGVLPFLLLAILVAVQLLLAGQALWSAGVAARRQARSELVHGGGGEAAAEVPVLRLVPGMPALRMEARTSLGPGRG